MDTVCPLQPMDEWSALPWKQFEVRVFKLQTRIYQASRRGDVKTVHRLQRLLMHSWAAKCLAVCRLTQDNPEDGRGGRREIVHAHTTAGPCPHPAALRQGATRAPGLHCSGLAELLRWRLDLLEQPVRRSPHHATKDCVPPEAAAGQLRLVWTVLQRGRSARTRPHRSHRTRWGRCVLHTTTGSVSTDTVTMPRRPRTAP